MAAEAAGRKCLVELAASWQANGVDHFLSFERIDKYEYRTPLKDKKPSGGCRWRIARNGSTNREKEHSAAGEDIPIGEKEQVQAAPPPK